MKGLFHARLPAGLWKAKPKLPKKTKLRSNSNANHQNVNHCLNWPASRHTGALAALEKSAVTHGLHLAPRHGDGEKFEETGRKNQ